MFLIILLLFPFIFLQESYAYSFEDVNLHNTPEDCWMIFDDVVYDLTEYIENHDKFQDIREWCGKDMTEDFITKDGVGRDHKEGSYALLEQYKIGEIDTVQDYNEPEDVTIQEDSAAVEEQEPSTPYNLVVPLFLSIFLYWIPYILIKKEIIKTKIKSFHAFWNTILLLLLLIPALGFGILMMLRYRFKSLWDIDFDFMYWHVELSLVMGILALNHFIHRFKIYLAQLNK